MRDTPCTISLLEWREYFHAHPERVNRGDCEHKITPLMAAVIAGRTDLVKEIISFGADLDLETEEGESARTFAIHDDMIKIFSNFPAPTLLTSWDLAI